MPDEPLQGTDVFSVDAGDAHGAIMLSVRGEADLATAPLLSEALTWASRNGHGRVVLDLAGLEFIDGHCIGILFDARAFLREKGSELVLRSAPPFVGRLLDIVQWHQPINESVAALG